MSLESKTPVVIEDVNRPLPPNVSGDIPFDKTPYLEGLKLAGLFSRLMAERFLYPISAIGGLALAVSVLEGTRYTFNSLGGEFPDQYLGLLRVIEGSMGVFGGIQFAALKRNLDYEEQIKRESISINGINFVEVKSSVKKRRDIEVYRPLLDLLSSKSPNSKIAIERLDELVKNKTI